MNNERVNLETRLTRYVIRERQFKSASKWIAGGRMRVSDEEMQMRREYILHLQLSLPMIAE